MKTNIPPLAKAFVKHFGQAPMRVVQAPGRVSLIGEHNDYNDGFVLPCAVDFYTLVACKKRRDQRVRVLALDLQESDEFEISQSIEKSDKPWANYVRGMIQSLCQRGFDFTGMDLAINGNVPLGAGLSSSASLEISVGQAVKTLYNLDISQEELALAGQQAENGYVGMNCGIMDQLIAAKGEVSKALLIDCRDLSTQAITVPPTLSILTINSNKRHALVDGEYNRRRAQCEAAAKQLGVKALRDATLRDLYHSDIEKLSETYRRVHHIITENERTLKMVEALKAADLKQISALMAQSHASMRDDFEITIPEIDYLVSIVSEVLGEQGGVRMTGSGFGGSVVALLPHELVPSVRDAVRSQYKDQTGIRETLYLCRPSAGAGVVM